MKKFFLIIGLSILIFPQTLAEENYLGSYLFAREHLEEQIETIHMLEKNIAFLNTLSASASDHRIYSMGAENILFLNRFSQKISSGNTLVLEQGEIETLEKFYKIDLKKYLEHQQDKSRALQNYIDQGKQLFYKSEKQSEFLTKQIQSGKLAIEQRKKKIKQISQDFKENLDPLHGENIPALQQEYIDESTKLARIETQYTKNKFLLSQHDTQRENLRKKLIGAEENFQALVLGVTVKKSSGEFVNVLE